MAKSSLIEIYGVGQVLFERSKRAKHLNIAVKPFSVVRVAVPYGLSFKNAEKIVNEKVDWIQKNLDKMKQVELEHKSILENSNEIEKTSAKLKLTERLNELSKKYNFILRSPSPGLFCAFFRQIPRKRCFPSRQNQDSH